MTVQTYSTNKTPAEVFPVEVDWTTWLGTDTLQGSPTAAVSTGDCTVSGIATANGVTTFLVGGGTAGTSCVVVATATAVGGKVEPVYIRIAVNAPPK